MDAEAVAAELYRAAPESFVAARDEAVKRARETGAKDVATQLAALRRPTRAAWLTNLLTASAPGEVGGFLALAGPLAEAQRSLDGVALRTVSAQKNTLLTTLARRAMALGREDGHRIDTGLEREVRGVLESALADEELAGRVRSGRLVSYERHSGFGPLPASGGSPARAAPVASTGSGASGRDREDRRRAEVDAAEQRAEQARLRANDAARDRAAARRRADEAGRDRDDAHQHVEDLRADLERARSAATDADRALGSAERDAAEADRRARAADTDLARAEQALADARET